MEKLTIEEFLHKITEDEKPYLLACCNECGTDTFHVLMEQDQTTIIGIMCTNPRCEHFYPRVEKRPDGPPGPPHPGMF